MESQQIPSKRININICVHYHYYLFDNMINFRKYNFFITDIHDFIYTVIPNDDYEIHF